MVREEAVVLVVEQNAQISDAITRAGKDLFFTAEVASDGWDAIEKLRDQRYAAIVIDTDVPRQSGYGVIRYLQQENGDDLANVIVVTGSDGSSLVRRMSDRVRVVDRNDAVNEVAKLVGAVE